MVLWTCRKIKQCHSPQYNNMIWCLNVFSANGTPLFINLNANNVSRMMIYSRQCAFANEQCPMVAHKAFNHCVCCQCGQSAGVLWGLSGLALQHNHVQMRDNIHKLVGNYQPNKISFLWQHFLHSPLNCPLSMVRITVSIAVISYHKHTLFLSRLDGNMNKW